MVMVPQNYEVSIARRYQRSEAVTDRYAFFAKAELGQMLQGQAEERFMVFAEKFPAPEWHLCLNRIDCSGKVIRDNRKD